MSIKTPKNSYFCIAMQKIVFALILLLVWSSTSQSQIIDFDAFAIASDTIVADGKISGSVSLSYNLEKQQNQITYFNSQSTLAYEKQKHFAMLNLGNRTTIDGNRQLQNTGRAQMRYMHNFRKRTFPEAYVQFQWDAQRGMRERSVFGGNLVHNLSKSKRNIILFHYGLFYEAELWDYSAVPSDRREALRPIAVPTHFVKANFHLKWLINISESTRLHLSTYYQARPDSYFNEPRISSWIRLNIDLNKSLVLSIGASGIYDFIPVVPIDNFFYTWNNSLVYRF